MPRLAGRRLAVLLLALALTPLGACSSHGGSADAGATAGEPLPPLPAGHLGDMVISSPAATWAKVRGGLGQPALFLPQSFGALAVTLVGLPITLSAEIDEAVPVVGAAAKQGRGPVQVVVGVHVKAGERLLDQLTRGEGARFNAVVDPATHVALLTDKVSPESAPLALGVLGNYLIVARRPADLYALGPHVVRRLGPAPAPPVTQGAPAPSPSEDLAMEIPEASLAGPLLDAARELRGQSEGGGDRGATLFPLAGMLDAAITLLGDASRAHLSVSLDAATLHARLTVAPKPGGAGSKLVADLPVGDVKPLLDLPEATTVGLLWRESAAAREENAVKQSGALARLFEGETTADDKAAIAAALRAEAQVRGAFQVMGLSFDGAGPTVVVRAPVTDAEAMKKALKQIVDLGTLPSFKKALAGLRVKLTSDKTVVENLAQDVTRVRLARSGDEPTKETRPKADPKKGAIDPALSGTPKAIDLLYFVDGAGLFAAAGLEPKDALRALVTAPSGPNLATNAPMASALAPVGAEATFVLVADAQRIPAMAGGAPPTAKTAPLVIAAGRSSAPAELWARADLPDAVVQQLVQQYARLRAAAPAGAL